jgi:hypothetical protein
MVATMKTYTRDHIERLAFRWANAWMRRFARIGAHGKQSTACMAASARAICARRGWEYEGSTLWEETTQVRDLFR